MKICVFGAGPAGLLVAHAARQVGAEVDIYSVGAPSKLYGAQYLHQPIPGLGDIPVRTIWHKFKGTIKGYRRKVYGLEWAGVVSPEQFGGTSSAWDIRHMYRMLVDLYWDDVIDAKVDGWTLQGAMDSAVPPLWALREKYDMVFSTIPRNQICIDPDHKFAGAEIWAIGDAPDLGLKNPIPTEASTLVCNGEPDVSWYRTFNVFDHSTTEWPKRKIRPPIAGVVPVLKPTQTNCDCFAGQINFLGRYGEWRKGVLTHHVYRRASELLAQ